MDNMEVKVEKEPTTFELRVGWSNNCSTLMLGENTQSWCYSSAEGKMAHMKTFEEYRYNLRRDMLLELSLTLLKMRSMLLSPRTERTCTKGHED